MRPSSKKLGKQKSSYLYHKGQLYAHSYNNHFKKCKRGVSSVLADNIVEFNKSLTLYQKQKPGLDLSTPQDKTYLIKQFYLCQEEARSGNQNILDLMATTTFAFIPAVVSKRWFSKDLHLNNYSRSDTEITLISLTQTTSCYRNGHQVEGMKTIIEKPEITGPIEVGIATPQPAVAHSPRVPRRCNLFCCGSGAVQIRTQAQPLRNVVSEATPPPSPR
jgi:hypothetical protein